MRVRVTNRSLLLIYLFSLNVDFDERVHPDDCIFRPDSVSHL